MQPAPPEKLLEAFQLLDVDGKGYVSKEYLSNLMISEGEPFSQEELDEMMATAVDNTTGMIPYEYYLNQLMVNNKLYSILTAQFLHHHSSYCTSTNLKIQYMI